MTNHSNHTAGIKELVTNLRAAQRYANPDLTDEALQRHRAERVAAAIDKATKQFQPAATLASQRAERARMQALANLTGGDATSLVRREQAWKKAKMLLEAGRDLETVIANTTDPNILGAIVEWGPTWLQANTALPDDVGQRFAFQEPDTDWIATTVLERMAAVSEQSEYTTAQEAEAEASNAAVWDQLAGTLTSDQGTGRDSYEALAALHTLDPVAHSLIAETVFDPAASTNVAEAAL